MKRIPEFVKFIIEILKDQGYEAYLVGGCVRDSILGREPKDWDITTSATPDKVMDIFGDKRLLSVKAVVPTGIDFGTVTIVGVDGLESVEVTTFRGDIYTPDTGISHKPKCVEYVDDIVKDLSRRDFTINAIAYDIFEEEYIDPFNGVKDIASGTIKCVGIPGERFKEDPLRMLRAIRFASTLDFEIETKTNTSIIVNSELIKEMSAERIREELNKILLTDIGNIFYNRNSTSAKAIFNVILPEFTVLENISQNNPYHQYNVFTHSIESCRIIEPEIHLRLAALLHDLGKAFTKTTDGNGIDHFYGHAKISEYIAHDILKRLKYDNKTIDKVISLIKHHDRRLDATTKSVKKSMNVIGEDLFFDWCLLRFADIASQEVTCLKQRAKKIFKIEDIAHMILASEDPFTIKDLDMNGRDLIALGIKPGPQIKEILNHLLDLVIDNPNLNNKDILITKTKEYLNI